MDSGSNMNNNNNNNGNNPWGWLGLLKWSLSHSDGTSPSSEMKMSEEDRKFLETVMKEGIIDENDRMKEILKQVTNQIELWRQQRDAQEEEEQKHQKEEEENIILDLLQELRDIIEQIDYARAFCALKGLNFILGIISSSLTTTSTTTTTSTMAGTMKNNKAIVIIPQSIQLMCLGILSTLCQHNPPVQKELLELGSLKILTNLFFQHMVQYYQYQQQQQQGEEEIEQSNHNNHYNNKDNIKFCSKIIQAMSANVRSYDMAETLFLNLNEQSKQFIELGLGMKVITTTTTNKNKKKQGKISFPLLIRKRTLFFLSSLLASDVCTSEYIDQLFINSIDYVIENFIIPQQQQPPPTTMMIDDDDDDVDGIVIDEELRENSVLMIETLLEQKKCLSSLLLKVPKYKFIIELANQRQQYINTLPNNSDDKEFAKIEYQSWDHIKLLLQQEKKQQQQQQQQPQQQQPQQTSSSSDSKPLLLSS